VKNEAAGGSSNSDVDGERSGDGNDTVAGVRNSTMLPVDGDAHLYTLRRKFDGLNTADRVFDSSDDAAIDDEGGTRLHHLLPFIYVSLILI
jgi:hypothetical protein